MLWTTLILVGVYSFFFRNVFAFVCFDSSFWFIFNGFAVAGRGLIILAAGYTFLIAVLIVDFVSSGTCLSVLSLILFALTKSGSTCFTWGAEGRVSFLRWERVDPICLYFMDFTAFLTYESSSDLIPFGFTGLILRSLSLTLNPPGGFQIKRSLTTSLSFQLEESVPHIPMIE